MSRAEFADGLGWTKARLNEFVRGKRGVTAGAALDLVETPGTSRRLRMNPQATCDLAVRPIIRVTEGGRSIQPKEALGERWPRPSRTAVTARHSGSIHTRAYKFRSQVTMVSRSATITVSGAGTTGMAQTVR